MMTDRLPPPPRTSVMRWARVYASPLRERFPADETPADDLMELLEQADRQSEPQSQAGGG